MGKLFLIFRDFKIKGMHVFLCFIFVFSGLFAIEIKEIDTNIGQIQNPFKTINTAALQAFPGDTITVDSGKFREWI